MAILNSTSSEVPVIQFSYFICTKIINVYAISPS